MGHGGGGYREGDRFVARHLETGVADGEAADAGAQRKIIEGLEPYLDELEASADWDPEGHAVVVPKGRKHF